MSKLPAPTPLQIIKILERSGFILDRVRGSHHIYIHSELKKRVTVPLHKRDLPKGTLSEILKQAGIDKKELNDLK